MPKELGVAQAARRLGVTLDAIYRQLAVGRIPARKEGGRWLIAEDWVEQRLKERGKHDAAEAPALGTNDLPE